MVPDGLLRDLAARSPGELAALLDARPDAVRPGTTTTAELAEALLSRAGLSRAVDELSRPELDALERAAVLGVPDGSAAALLAAPPWDRLHRLGLVHRDGDALRLVPGAAEALGRYPAADGPAFFTLTIMLLLLIPLIGFTWVLFRPSPVMLLLITGGITTVVTLILLRFVKGAFIGYLWAKNEQDRGA